MMSLGFMDCHCHLLPGLDDGPMDIQESLEMSRILSSFGFSDITCTPHIVKGVYEISPSDIKKAVENFQNILDKAAIPLILRPAAEYRFDEFLHCFLDNPLPIGKNLVLIDANPSIQPHVLLELAYLVITKSEMKPLIAHPERYDFFDDEMNENLAPTLLSSSMSRKSRGNIGRNTDRCMYRTSQGSKYVIHSLREMGCLFQGSLGSFAGIYGNRVLKRAICFLRTGLYDRLGTDAHRLRDLAVWLAEGKKSVMKITGKQGLDRLLRPLEVFVS